MLYHIAVADAYGAGREMASYDFIHANNCGTKYVQHLTHKLKPGSYTDDTQMSLALAEHLLADDPWTPLDLANRFVATFKRDQREGYSRHFYEILTEVNSGVELITRLAGKNQSQKSGAAMRSGVLGLLPNKDDLMSKVEVQSRITHDTIRGVDSAIAAALMVHFFAHGGGDREHLPEYLNREIPGYEFHVPWYGYADSYGIDCVRAATTAVAQSGSFSHLLQVCTAFGGDVDTVAAIAAAAAWLDPDLATVPLALDRDLENNDYGLHHLFHIDRLLLAKFPVTRK